MSAALGQVAAVVGAVKMMANLKSAWTRAHGDGVRLYDVPGWLAYYGGRDPHEGKRCVDCQTPLTASEIAGRMECCETCWFKRLAASQAHKSAGRRYEP